MRRQLTLCDATYICCNAAEPPSPAEIGEENIMKLRELLEAGPAKANGIFASLLETSNGAVKSREKLFTELKSELERLADLEEGHVFPVLKQHEQTKDLVPDAIKGNKELRAKLAALDALSKDDEAFIPKLEDLMKGFQHILRDEKKALLPAVLRAVSEDQVEMATREQAAQQAASQKTAEEAARKAAENKAAERAAQQAAEKKAAESAAQKAAEKKAAEDAAQKAAERARSIADKKAAEQAADKAAEKKAAEQSRKAAERTAARAAQKAADQKAAEEARKAVARKAAERARKAAERKAAEKAARKAAEGKAARARQRAMEQNVARQQARDNARNPGPDFQALAAFSMAATRGMAEMGSAWMEWLGGSSSVHAQLSQQLVRCRTMQEVAHTQQSFIAGSAQSWIEHNARVLQISRHVADEGLRALGGRRQGPAGQ